jgi:hypothetical protein
VAEDELSERYRELPTGNYGSGRSRSTPTAPSWTCASIRLPEKETEELIEAIRARRPKLAE